MQKRNAADWLAATAPTIEDHIRAYFDHSSTGGQIGRPEFAFDSSTGSRSVREIGKLAWGQSVAGVGALRRPRADCPATSIEMQDDSIQWFPLVAMTFVV